MLDIYFPTDSLPPGLNRTYVNETFSKGGYYFYDIGFIPGQTIVHRFIALNTAYFLKD
jgi:hypothetical protein